MPLLVGLIAEAGLRLAGYGYRTSFFKPQKMGQEEYLVENDKFGLRFFPPELARSPAPVVLKRHKEPGSCRIFIFGESAALGDPRPAYGAGRYLEALLCERFPQNKFEVACVAMTAINSHAVREIARECARHEGDLWILYLGNNEMIGPFGATGVIGSQAPPLGIIRLNLALQRTRLGQALISLSRSLKKAPAEGTWGGMEMWTKNHVPAGDPRKEKVYRNFRANLEAVLRSARGAGPDQPKVILSTMAVNLLDCSPLATESSTNLSEVDQAHFKQLAQEATAAIAQTNFAKAAEDFAGASRLDPQRADIEYGLAACLFAQGDTNGARTRFVAARDLDALPFRADSRLNRELKQAAEKYAGPSLAFFDAEALLSSASPAGIPGKEFFYEHVHLTFDGNYRLARAWAERAEQLLGTALTAPSAGSWASQEICERRLGLTDWNRAGVIGEVLSRLTHAPLSTQASNPKRVEALRSRLKELRQAMSSPEAPLRARQLYTEALAGAPRDHRLHENFAEYLEGVGDFAQATAEWQQVSALLPHHHLGYFQSGRLLARQRQFPAAEAALKTAVQLRPDLAEGWLELGLAQLAQSRPAAAMDFFERAKKVQSQDPRTFFYMGQALSKLDRRPESIQQYREAVRLNGNYVEALYSLGEELAFNGQVAEAKSRFQDVVKLRPDHALAHLNLGVCLVKEGQAQEAVREFDATLKADPKNELARQYLEKMRGGR